MLVEAFGDRERINLFRRSFGAIAADRIKRITNMLAYGNGGKEWCKGRRDSRHCHVDC
jgi:hypothetical protein